MAIEHFVVDAKLLRELGERLVGRPHIALAELIKNSYDADARKVEIRFSGDSIDVIDDGHGMSYDDFVDKWMRIGTVHKQRRRRTPELNRAYTGSKGIGRLAAQVLGRAMEIDSVALKNQHLDGVERRHTANRSQLHDQVSATIDWDDAIDKATINEVEVELTTSTPSVSFSDGSACGTWITLRRLATRWDAVQFRRLAQEVWALQPPFQLEDDDDRRFAIELVSEFGDVVAEFDRQMHAILDIWVGRVQVTLVDMPPSEAETFTLIQNSNAAAESSEQASLADDALPTRWLRVEIHLRGERPHVYVVRVPKCRIVHLHYEIRIFDLIDRQPDNVKVGQARDYLRSYGGVSLFDQGFRLPYYGADQDWLSIERDNARRISTSALLPPELQVDRAMLDLPTTQRMFGSVYVSTAKEAERATAGSGSQGPLTIQVTRDRLVSNDSYYQLRDLVRVGVDLYTRDVARRRAAKALARRRTAQPSDRFRDVAEQVAAIKDQVPAKVFQSLSSSTATAIKDAEAIERSARAHTSLLAALATTGMMSLAYDHDASKQIGEVTEAAKRLRRIAKRVSEVSAADELRVEADRLLGWAERANKLRKMFRSMADEESREIIEAYNARKVIDSVVEGVDVLRGRTTVDTGGLPTSLVLPRAAEAAWTAVFQNVLVNAFNATADVENDPRVDVDGGVTGQTAFIRIQDNGIGVDLDEAQNLFEPYVRGIEFDRRRAEVGLGGSGLGLAIVRMIATELNVNVSFDKPDDSHETSIVLRWSE